MQNLEFKLIVPLWGGSKYIELNQLLKLAGLCDSGGAGKAMVAEGSVSVDGRGELRNSSSSLKVIQGGDKRATKTVQVVRPGASAEANTVALIKWNWNKTCKVRAGSVVTLGEVHITVKAA